MSSRPPEWAERVLAVMLPPRHRDHHLGDLSEGFARRATDPRRARRWYVGQVIRSIPGALRLRYQARNDHIREPSTMDSIRQDLRFALRSLRKSPGFAVVATVTLALAIGVNTSIFSLVSAIVFAELPMQDAETVAIVRAINPELGIGEGRVSAADYLDLKERSRSFASLSALAEDRWVVTGSDRPERVEGIRMSVETTDTWRLPPVLGRAFTPDEGEPGGPPVAMLTHGFWQDRFDASPDVLGWTIRLDGEEHTIVGVMRPDFEFATFRQAQVITPLRLTPATADRGRRELFVSGRLAPEATQEGATDEVRRIGQALAEEYPGENAGWGLGSAPVLESLMDDSSRTVMLLLQLAVAMVILIACANVANMLLARATARAREMAVRTAMGAARARLVRQLLTESFVVSAAAAALGLAVAFGLNEALVWISAGTEEVFLLAEVNGRVLAFTLLVSLMAPMAFGLFPAFRASGMGTAVTLRDGRGGGMRRSGNRARGVLVTAQIALAATLMIVAGLLTRTVVNLHVQPVGADLSGVLTARVDLPESSYGSAGAIRFFREARGAVVEAGLRVGDVELTSGLPGIDAGAGRSLEIEGIERTEGRSAPLVRYFVVSPGLIESLGIGMRRGRALRPGDDEESLPVAVVSQEVVSRFFGGMDAVGRRVRFAGTDDWLQVVGVAGDVYAPDREGRPTPAIYVPHAQHPIPGMYLIIQTGAPSDEAAPAVREAVWSIDTDLPVEPIRSMERAAYEGWASDYALITLFGTFALFALIMATVGIYGVMAYSVSQRRREIGVRLALGAEVSSVRRMVLGQGARMVGAGLAIGLVVAYGLSMLLRSIVVGVSPTDPLTFIGVPLLLGLVAFAANLVPARRATRMDPASSLREG